MKIAIMQPYLFPYIGYFQLIFSVDKFILYNDVNYIKQGWINRNNFLENGEKKMVTFPVKNSSSNKLIKDIEFNLTEREKIKFLKFLNQNYSKSPNYNEVIELVEKILSFEDKYLDRFIYNSIIEILKYLNIKKDVLFSSQIEKNNDLKGENKVIDICKKINATNYINPIGGTELYSHKNFESAKIKLNFIKTPNFYYQQLNNEFVSNLSIIDVLMFNSKEKIIKLLNSYELV